MTEPAQVVERKRLQRARELAAEYDVSERAILRLAQRGEIPSLRIGRLLRFDPEAVRAALERKGARA